MEQSVKLTESEIEPAVMDDRVELAAGKSILARPSKLLNRDFVLFWQSQTISQLGTQVHTMAMVLWIKDATNSASLIGLLMMVTSIPAVLLSGVAGAFADRHSRRRIILVSDLIRGALVITLAGLLYFRPDAVQAILIWLFVGGTGVSVMGAFFRPAVSAAIPDLIPDDEIAKANSLRQLTMQLSLFLGRGLGGTLYLLLGAPLLAFVNGLSFLFSSASIALIRIPQNIPDEVLTSESRFSGFVKDLAEGFLHIWKAPGLRALFFFSAIFNFFVMPIIVLLPFYVEDFLNLNAAWYGYLLAIYGGGTLAGSLMTGFLKMSGKVRGSVMVAFAILNSVTVAMMGFARGLEIAILLAFLVGVMGAFNGIHVNVILQTTTPSEIRGRVFGLLSTLSASLSPLGMGLGGLAFDLTGQDIPLIFKSCGVIMLLLSFLVAQSKEFRDFLAYEPSPQQAKTV